ncbi:hypothetical protein LOK49_LG10G01849 [Camellia lanceoleosa]|uniref:Uncharacterized protein n=1 Tax=Camellia lanceoleosa TaxID=1840588 RepID=A0ACC0G9V1_9ERIC|nr:hypothetical protein LOK49_LG10G01849 [Camellia lanceoleosa]
MAYSIEHNMCRLTTRVTGPGHRLNTYRDLVNWSWACPSMPSPMTHDAWACMFSPP